MPDPLLEIKGLTIDFETEDGIFRAVDDVALSIYPGKVLGIVGESGSGKSVTALSVMGLLPAGVSRITGGSISFRSGKGKEIDLISLEENEFRNIRGNQIGMIFQEPMTSLNPVMRCGRQVAEVLVRHRGLSGKEARKETTALFTKVLLPDPERAYRAYPHELSGGQKQRVMIAMAIACRPVLLIADEPTTALDVSVQRSVLKLLASLQEESGISLMFISHDLAVVAEVADDVVIMQEGKVVERGPVDSVFRHPQHPYTRGLMACRPPLDVRLKKLPVVSDFLGKDDRTVEEAISNLAVPREERLKRLESLYSGKPILELRHVTTTFRDGKKEVRAVDNVSLDVFPGETVGLVGESGCGKTTLGRTILRLVDSSGGTILYRGINEPGSVRGGMKSFRKNAQIIFQDPYSSLNPRMTAGNAIMEPMKVHHLHKNKPERKEKTLELLEKVGLEARHFNRYPHEFSGGQRQRICIARALALEPEFIICDESVSALDVSIQAQVLNLLNSLKEEFGFTYIFISHDLSVVKYMSDRVFVMKDGMIVEHGEADELFSQPRSSYTRDLIS